MRRVFKFAYERSEFVHTDPFVSGDIACPVVIFFSNNHFTLRGLKICNLLKDLSQLLLACLLACFSVAAVSQVRPVYELPDKEEIQRGARELVERVQRMDIKFEKDASGRLTRIISEGVATDIIYDANGKIDGFKTNGATTKARMATDIKGNAVLRIFDSKNNELQPVDLKSIGLPSSFIESVSGNKVLPTADMIDVKEFARMESQRASERINYFLSIMGTKKPQTKMGGGCEDLPFGCDGGEGIDTGGGGSGGGRPHYTPQQQQQCRLKCDYDKNIATNECDRENSVRRASCGAGALLGAEVPIAGGIFGLACLALSESQNTDCKNKAAKNLYQCSSSCQ